MAEGLLSPLLAHPCPPTTAAAPNPPQVVSVGDFRIGVCHGHQVVPWGDRGALAILQRRLDAAILVTGHTHRVAAYQDEGRVVINPGSATGAYSAAAAADAAPSFVLLDVEGRRATVYIYELAGEEVKVDKLEFSKGAAAATALR